MPVEKSHAIVLRRQDFRESSLLVTLYTKDFGKITGIAKGVKTSNPNFSSYLELFNHVEIVFYERSRSQLYLITQVDIVNSFNEIRKDLIRLSYASFIIQLLDEVTELKASDKEIFDLSLSALSKIATNKNLRLISYIYQIKLFHVLGLFPRFDICSRCGAKLLDSNKFAMDTLTVVCNSCANTLTQKKSISKGAVVSIEYIKNLSFEKLDRLKLTNVVNSEIEEVLNNFIEYNFHKKFSSLEFLKKIIKDLRVAAAKP